MAVHVTPYRELASDEMHEWEHLVSKAHPAGETRLGSDLRWADLEAETDCLLRCRADGELVACAWVTKRIVRIAEDDLPVAGIRGVFTHPDQRRRGYGRAVMERAQELMLSFPDCHLAVLFSSVMAVPFYESLGWRAIPGPVTVDQPGGRIDYTAALPGAPVMVLPLTQPASVPPSTVYVRGLPW
ncbi:MAG: GNAT family N-acetyltransferase [Streptosporangiaceae bacterium]